MKTGRNAPCPCGSGKKYKHCCERKKAHRADLSDSLVKGLFYLGGPLAIVIILAVAISAYIGRDQDEGARRVWSPAHGHWHAVDADGNEQPLREGLVWSEEHGHWHDAASMTDGMPEHFRTDAERELREAEQATAAREGDQGRAP